MDQQSLVSEVWKNWEDPGHTPGSSNSATFQTYLVMIICYLSSQPSLAGFFCVIRWKIQVSNLSKAGRTGAERFCRSLYGVGLE